MTDSEDERDFYDDDEIEGLSADCPDCHGDGWIACSDPLACTKTHNLDREHLCNSCGGTGDDR